MTTGQRVDRTPRRRPGALWIVSPWLALLVGLGSTWWIWSLVIDNVRTNASEQFLLRAAQVRIMLEKRLQSYEHVALTGAALFSAHGGVDRRQWLRYTGTLRIHDYYPGLQALAYLPRVPVAARAAHEAQLRAEGFADYRIRSTDQGSEYFPLQYLAPEEDLLQVLGFDAASSPVRVNAMDLARDMGQPVMTTRLTLASRPQEADVPAFVIYAPVFHGDDIPVAVEERRQRLRGFIASAFEVPMLLEGLLKDQQLEINFAIHEGIQVVPDTRLYRYQEQAAVGELAHLEHHDTITVAGRLWTLRFSPLPQFVTLTASQMPRVIALSGCLMSLMLFGLTRALLGSRWLLGRLRERGRELEREIQRRERVESSLAQARDAAEAASLAKSNFLANVSHELRTPLNGILGFTQILEADSKLHERHRRGLRVIRHSGDYLLTIVNDLLDISQVESNRLELYPGDIHLPSFLQRIVNLFHLRAEEQGLEFVYRQGSRLPTGVRADEKRLRQLLVNLLSNAVKFTERGEVRLMVDCADVGGFVGVGQGRLLAGQTTVVEPSHGQQLLRFQVEDTGCGIESAQFDQLVRPFYQVGRVTQKAEGLGLGLALCRELVERMGGALWLRSEPGRGSAFWVILPLTLSDGVVPAEDFQETVGQLSTVVGPPADMRLEPEQAALLQDLALMGDVNGLLAAVDTLEAEGRLGGMAGRLRTLIQNFQLEEVADLVAETQVGGHA